MEYDTFEYIAQESKDFKESNQHHNQEQPHDCADTACDEYQDLLDCVIHLVSISPSSFLIFISEINIYFQINIIKPIVECDNNQKNA